MPHEELHDEGLLVKTPCVSKRGVCKAGCMAEGSSLQSTTSIFQRHCVSALTMRMSSGVAMATSVSARSEPNALYAQDRTDRMNFTAPMPLFATRMLQASRQAFRQSWC